MIESNCIACGVVIMKVKDNGDKSVVRSRIDYVEIRKNEDIVIGCRNCGVRNLIKDSVVSYDNHIK